MPCFRHKSATFIPASCRLSTSTICVSRNLLVLIKGSLKGEKVRSLWGGLRVGSESRLLTWEDVDWERDRLTLHTPKTEHHKGRDKRVMPLFPELKPLLQDVFDMAEEGEPMVLPFPKGRSDASLRMPMERAIKLAGLEQWPRLWHNLRARRQTEFENDYPTHLVCGWLGNTLAVAHRNYLQVTDEHFAEATGSNSAPTPTNAGVERVHDRVQKRVQEVSGMVGNAPESAPETRKNPPS